MQYEDIEIRALQLVLAFLGFYPGAIDGLWSASTINAMKKFEMDDSFLPAVPTGGLPFPVNARLPKGMFWEKRLVSHRRLTKEAAAEILTKRSHSTARVQGQEKAVAKVVEPVVETVVEKTGTDKPAPVKPDAQK